jgi:hypothetical protein
VNLQEIHTVLSEGPSRIEQAAKAVAEARAALDRSKRACDKARAMATINHQTAKNQTILNALVENDSLVDQAEAEVIKCHAEYLIAQSKHELAKDQFDAAKKESNLMEAEMRSFASQRPSPRP